MSRLALAYERQLIGKGSELRLTVQNASREKELRRSSDHPDARSKNGKIPVIILQLIRKGRVHDAIIDLDLDNAANF